jgi:NADH-quinone oxidoreductase subunit H
LIVIVLISYTLDLRRKKSDEAEEQRAALEAEQEFDPFAGGFPVPPMPGQVAQASRRTKVTISSGAAATQTTTETTEGTNV